MSTGSIYLKGGHIIHSSSSSFKFTFIYYIYNIKKLLQSNLTDLQVAKTNQDKSVSQVLKYYRCQEKID